MQYSRLPVRPPYLSITLLSASALAYEVLLMRLFTIIQWHHFAYMVIGLALLGYGISGTLISIFKQRLTEQYVLIYIVCLLLFGATSIACYALAQSIPFNAEEIFWNNDQIVYLSLIFLSLTIPFVLAATAICLSFVQFKENVPRIYAADLIGAGLGSLMILLLLYWFFPQSILTCIGITGVGAAILAIFELPIFYKKLSLTIAAISLLLLLGSGSFIQLNISPYKGLPQTLQIDGTKIIEERSSPLGYLSFVHSEQVPFRHAPGLSFQADYEPLNQIGIFTDADNMSVITRYPDDLNKLQYLDQMTSAAPYHLNQLNQILIIGAGGGADVLQARYHETAIIEAIEINPQIINAMLGEYADFSGHLYRQKNVTIHLSEARSFLSDTAKSYDLVQLSLVDTFNASSAGLYALNESYLYTLEAVKQYLQHLKPDGYLAMTRWIKLPPRDSLKLVATAITALEQHGAASPDKQIVLIRSWQTSTLIVKNGIFTEQELARLQLFCEQRAFDLAYTPRLTLAQVNRFNILAEPVFFQAVSAMLGEQRQQFFEQYKFNITPATDDRPYFHNYFKWSSFEELYQLRQQGGMPLIEWGYIILIATLLVAILLSIILIILPLWFYRRLQQPFTGTVKRTGIFYYFLAIGLAFLFIEIAFIQKFTLLLHHPITTIAVVLTAFLVFAGIGSLWSGQLLQQHTSLRIVAYAVTGITVLCTSYLFLLDPLFQLLATITLPLKVIIVIGIIAPLAICMGIPFPAGLATLSRFAGHYVPWAWGINGCASVISAVLATVLALHFGFSMVILAAVILYLSIIIAHRGFTRSRQQELAEPGNISMSSESTK